MTSARLGTVDVYKDSRTESSVALGSGCCHGNSIIKRGGVRPGIPPAAGVVISRYIRFVLLLLRRDAKGRAESSQVEELEGQRSNGFAWR